MAARIIAKEDAGYTVNWKLPSGFVTLDAATIIALADAMRAHVQKCFDAEESVLATVNEYLTVQEIQEAFDAAYAA
jgi:hypothetical protein